jgi:hypothetical protein
VPQLKPPLNAIKARLHAVKNEGEAGLYRWHARFNVLTVINQSVSLALDCSQVAQHEADCASNEADCASIRVGHLPPS